MLSRGSRRWLGPGVVNAVLFPRGIVIAYLDIPLRDGYATNWSHCLVLFLC